VLPPTLSQQNGDGRFWTWDIQRMLPAEPQQWFEPEFGDWYKQKTKSVAEE